MKDESTYAIPSASTNKDFGPSILAIIRRMLWIVPSIALFCLVLLLAIGRTKLSQSGAELTIDFVYAALISLPSAVVITRAAHRYAGRSPLFVIPVYTLILVCTATCGILVGDMLLELIGIFPQGTYWREFWSAWPFSIVITMVVGLSITYFETLRGRLQTATLELHTRQVEQERANKLLAEARLSSLESRIHPHFLFNTLNSIASLIPSDPRRAEDTVGKLASLLRFSISANQTSLVPLAQELKIVRDYLEIETTRFGLRLHYEISVPDSLGDFKVPPLALQTLVENSVKHVVAQRNQPSFIGINGTQYNGRLEITVSDDGPGFTLADVAADHGLGNLVGRLELLFGESAQLNVQRIADKTIVSISIPAGVSR